MPDQDKDFKKEKLISPEQDAQKANEYPKNENIPTPERLENIESEKRVSEQIRKEIDLMEMDEKKKEEAKKKAQKIEFLGEKEKVQHLLEIAREKGVIFAVGVARKMNDPYLLDIFHDILAKEGYFKDFTK
jgi:hypothetical protein